MFKYVLNVEGMMCAHCEAHMNDTIKKQLNVKSVESSHEAKQTVIISEELDEQEIKNAVAQSGYELKGIEKYPYVKKGIFSKFKK